MKSIKEDCLCLDIASKVLVNHQEELSAVQNVVTRVIIITMMNNNEVHAYIGVAKVWSRVKSARSLPGPAAAYASGSEKCVPLLCYNSLTSWVDKE